jgi:hypothetical protein
MWTKEKNIEYWNLKREGYTFEMLKEHFGDDIYDSEYYNKNASSLPYILKFDNFLNEIKLTPESVDYSFTKQPSKFFRGESDYIISFFSNNIPYIICLLYFPINNKETFNIIFTTRNQWNDYEFNILNLLRKGQLTEDDFEKLNNIIGKETGFDDIFPIFRKISWILFDFYNTNIKGSLLSLGETTNPKKIKIYKNIIKDSFPNVVENTENIENHKYFIYEIT